MLTGIEPHKPATIVCRARTRRDQGKGSVDPIVLVFGVVAGFDSARINSAGLVMGANFLPIDGGTSDFSAAPDEFLSLG